MHTPTLLTTLLAFTGSAFALGKARVINNCTTEVTAWSVGSEISVPFHLGPHGGFYAETFVKDPKTGGKAIKITIPQDGLFTGAPQTNFAYALDGETIWYDLSYVFGETFAGKKLVVEAGKGCPSIVWPKGQNPGGSQTRACSSASDVTLTLCAA